MEEITIVKRRTRPWTIVLALVLIALVVLAALWLMGDIGATAVGGLQPMSNEGSGISVIEGQI